MGELVQLLKTSEPIPFGKYRLLDKISQGGMAEVFRAKTFGAAGFERTVAIKLLLPTVAEDDDFVTMLIDEAKIAGQLSHANIAQIFDLGQAEGRYYIVQEYINGRDLRAILKHLSRSKRRLTVGQAVHIVLKMCEGLEYAHNKRDANGQPLNVVHRDVSPQNVVVSMEGEVKLIDFGIAKAEGRRTQTMAGLVKGKFAYMSPEQIRGLPVDRRSDVFATGIVLHELLTSKSLFRRKSEFETLKRARSGKIDPPSVLNPDVPPELDRIVLSALARHVEDRYQSAIELRDALWEFSRTSGHFFSRNELSSWMLGEFGPGEEPVEPGQIMRTSESEPEIEPLEDFPSIEIGDAGPDAGGFSDSQQRTIINLDDDERDSASRSGELEAGMMINDIGLAYDTFDSPSIEVDGMSHALESFEEHDTADLRIAMRSSQRMTAQLSVADAAAMPNTQTESSPRQTMMAGAVPAPIAGRRPAGAPSSASQPPMMPPRLVAKPEPQPPKEFPRSSIRNSSIPSQIPASSSPSLAPLARPSEGPSNGTPEIRPRADTNGIRPGSIRPGSSRTPLLTPPSVDRRAVAPAKKSWLPLVLAMVVLAGATAATLVLLLNS